MLKQDTYNIIAGSPVSGMVVKLTLLVI